MMLSSRDILAFSAARGVGPSTIFKIVADYELRPDVVELPPRLELAFADKVARTAAYAFADEQIKRASETDVTIVTRLDGKYPQILRRFPEAPAILYVKGDVASLSTPTIGVIGTREPTPHGDITTRRITEFLCLNGLTIVSGLALGCDAVAHEECIRVGGKGIAVLAHGLQTIAPKRNAPLAEALMKTGGAIVSEFALGVEPQPRLFVQRDKTQALLSRGVVMVQSDLKGGSLHASRAAIKYSKPLIIPYPTSRDRSNKEPKIQANMLIADASAREKCDLLQCKEADLDNVMILRGREQYPAIADLIKRNNDNDVIRLL
jgi:DNA processing protein